jgi:hypothetical protein
MLTREEIATIVCGGEHPGIDACAKGFRAADTILTRLMPPTSAMTREKIREVIRFWRIEVGSFAVPERDYHDDEDYEKLVTGQHPDTCAGLKAAWRHEHVRCDCGLADVVTRVAARLAEEAGG